MVYRIYRIPGLTEGKFNDRVRKLKRTLKDSKSTTSLTELKTETCFYIDSEGELTAEELAKLEWILTVPFQENNVSKSSFLTPKGSDLVIEIGPRLNFSTAFSTNAVSICATAGLRQVRRLEASTRYHLIFDDKSTKISAQLENDLVRVLHDRMTECRYLEPIASFALDVKPEPWYEVDIMKQGRKALENANVALGLALDEWDLDYYTNLFFNKLKRNPTSVECFDLAQSNSEHSRHWFFKGRMIIDKKEQEKSLFKMIMDTQNTTNKNNVIQFSDNSSAIQGFDINGFVPQDSSTASEFYLKKSKRHIIFTAETHNFPTGVAPFSGATTGTGGRIRDVEATGRGGHVIAGTAGYSFGNLLIPGYDLPWEDPTFHYPSNFAPPAEIAVEASNGASDYGNKFGEPVLAGFARSFGMKLADGERREWIKPIMFSGGIGSMEADQVTKFTPEPGMDVVKIGGPIYRIGVGGGAASSIQVQGDNSEELDFGAVQRGDPEMEQKLNRIIRACIEYKENPIKSIHDQGAGGNGNVLKEISEPSGAVIYTKEFTLGDPTISTMELWGAEYQESNAILSKSTDRALLNQFASREKCQVSFVGDITNNGKIILVEGDKQTPVESSKRQPVDLDLELVLGKMPAKDFNLDRVPPVLKPMVLPIDLSVRLALERVLRLPSVASKRYLTNKVDRCVTGLVAQQQCVGPLHTPLADVAVVALSHFDTVGGATAIGEQPIKGLLDPGAGARMSVAEAVTNLMFAPITSLQDVKCSGNWMWAAKLKGEGAALYDACQAMCKFMGELGIAVDGGKDSLSMAARVQKDTVKAPGTLVVSAYAPCTDITATVTPDFKCPNGKGFVVYVDLSKGQYRLGGSALAQCFSQLGDSTSDLADANDLRKGFAVTQSLIKDRKVIAGHDISDGGLITCLMEMAFAGNSGFEVDISSNVWHHLNSLFAEEIGWVLEIRAEDVNAVLKAYETVGLKATHIGYSVANGVQSEICLNINGEQVLKEKMVTLRDIWEETSFVLERRQTNVTCVEEEQTNLKNRIAPPYKLTFTPKIDTVRRNDGPKVAVVREEGINGDREMAAALHMVGFQVFDVTMTDLDSGRITLDKFQGLIFPGGFSYADVLGSAKGWAAGLTYNERIARQFNAFFARSDTWSLGVCNGCQLLALLGWVAPSDTESDTRKQGVFLDTNKSERFECRFSTVKIENSPSIMLQGMQDSVLGVWIAHGEGRFVFQSEEIKRRIDERKLVALRYVDDNGNQTTEYPLNPNGTIDGIAGICSEDGRHLAMMPHPERCVLPWQWPWMPQSWREQMKVTPWLHFFRNAYDWCCNNKS